MAKKEPPKDWKIQPWWELDEGWRVHLNPESEHFGRCWNIYTGDETNFTMLCIRLYDVDQQGWEGLITKALEQKDEPLSRGFRRL